ncbi:MAG: ATP-binding protein [Thermoanaerobaculales bacterium]
MATRKKPDPRKMMELAISVMKESIPEPREDNKASPLVGAVLVKADGSVDTASRGELRHGDHAEFTLLERMNRGNKLDDAVLFSTLEPCAPGSRRHPKLSCAERIVLARIKEVWIGIEDPDPTIDRKGIKYLQDSDVNVHLFDRDLQETIHETNREFIDQAEERAAAARGKKEMEPIVLSGLEEAIAATKLQDFQKKSLERYRSMVGIADKVNSEEFNRRLFLQGLLQEQDGKLLPTGFGLLLFGKEPRARMPQAGLLGTIHYADGREETRDFDGPAVAAPADAIQWLKDKLPNPIDRTQAERREVNEALFELTREGIVNAMVHRDYGIEGAKCQVIAHPDKIVVMSPGLPVEPITMDQLKAFDAPMLSRNPVLHFVFARMKLAEERGLGLKSMKSRASAARLPLPAYSYQAPFVVLTIYQEAKAAIPESSDDILAQLSEAERNGWDWLATRDTVTTAEYQKAIGVPNRTAKNHIKKMTELGLLKMLGAGRATRYEVVRS